MPAARTIDYGGSPMIITLPNGRLVYKSYGSGDVLVNTNNGAGAWTPVRTTMPRGYSRMLQYVAGTGRVLILSVEGFWVEGRNSVRYGDVDLGYSVGAYYKLVNRKSGKALDAHHWSLQYGANLVQWADTGGANRRLARDRRRWRVPDPVQPVQRARGLGAGNECGRRGDRRAVGREQRRRPAVATCP